MVDGDAVLKVATARVQDGPGDALVVEAGDGTTLSPATSDDCNALLSARSRTWAEVEAVTRVGVKNYIHGGKAAVSLATRLVLRKDWMALSSGSHVFVTAQHALHRSLQDVRWNSGRGCYDCAPALLASKATADALCLCHNLVLWNTENACDLLLMQSQSLR